MTEAEWLVCTKLHAMLQVLEGKASDRKLRLVGRARSRRIWCLLPHGGNRHLVAVIEDFPESPARGRRKLSIVSEALAASSDVEHLFSGHDGYLAVKNLGRSFYKGTPAYNVGLIASIV